MFLNIPFFGKFKRFLRSKFVLYSFFIVTVLAINIFVPPFQSPDEFTHLNRAVGVSFGNLISGKKMI